MRYCSIDRIEGETAVLLFDDGRKRHVATAALEFYAVEGMVLQKRGRRYLPDEEESNRRRAEAAAMIEKLLKKE
ncbi:MAG: DUF3006 domain-containing protein [Oscillospiraceae bacterium]|nr:DUF3006 domain-containing protein [Oscillospiraceae bacterium]